SEIGARLYDLCAIYRAHCRGDSENDLPRVSDQEEEGRFHGRRNDLWLCCRGRFLVRRECLLSHVTSRCEPLSLGGARIRDSSDAWRDDRHRGDSCEKYLGLPRHGRPPHLRQGTASRRDHSFVLQPFLSPPVVLSAHDHHRPSLDTHVCLSEE